MSELRDFARTTIYSIDELKLAKRMLDKTDNSPFDSMHMLKLWYQIAVINNVNLCWLIRESYRE